MATFSLKPGVRVVRGPDWTFGKQDSGEGFLGTVIYVPKKGSGDKVTVLWDSGMERRYSAGHEGKYDLRIYDTGQIGIQHNVKCNGCGSASIMGMRWNCSQCSNVNLCNNCYMLDKHDIDHGFRRIDIENGEPWTAPRRKDARKVQAKGCFQGTKVMKGPHWESKNEDGDKEGEIQKVTTFDNRCYRGAVVVKWKHSGETKTYRLGGGGYVDVVLSATKDLSETGGKFYIEHLPLCDVVSPGRVQLKPSDKVTVSLSSTEFRKLQEDDDFEWEEGMQQCTRETGTIVAILYDGRAARVQYEDSNIYILNRVVLTRKHTFNKDEAAVVLSDYHVVVKLQEGHGGWNDNMKKTLGKNGRIMNIEHDGDIHFLIDSDTWVFSPVCINPVMDITLARSILKNTPVPEPDEGDTWSSDESSDESELDKSVTDVAEKIAELFVSMLKSQPGVTTIANVNLVKAAADGEYEQVKSILQKCPTLVEQEKDGKSALHLAAYGGHTKVVELLIEYKAKIDKPDLNGDTPLHYAACGDDQGAIKCLLTNNAKKDIQNNSNKTPLHVTVEKGDWETTELLLKHQSDVNIQDKNGDTVMHLAIKQTKGQPELTNVVLKAQHVNYGLTNGKGFNVLHIAAQHNDQKVVDLVIERNKDLVDSKKPKEETTALHIAAFHNHVDIVKKLIRKGKANVNIQDANGMTALHTAVCRNHQRVVERLLTAEGCDVNMKDKNQDTPLHLALSKSKELCKEAGKPRKAKEVHSQIIFFLLDSKVDIYAKNKDDRTPMDLAADDTTLHDFMKLIITQKNTTSKSERGIRAPSHWDDMGKDRVKHVKISDQIGGMPKIEFDTVCSKFRHTMPQSRIFSVTRIQNLFFWEVYSLTKKDMEKRKQNEGCANEMDLFHGTSPEWIQSISKENLDFRLAGNRVGALFGKGAYLAREAKTADLYADYDKNSHKFMFLVKALVGNFCTGRRDYSLPPRMNDDDVDSPRYDCCVDNVDDPLIFCLFDTNQYYPEYIIEYK